MAPRPNIYTGMLAELEQYIKPGRQSVVLKGKIFADHKLLPMHFIDYGPSGLKNGDIVQFELDNKKQPINIRKLF
jgi:hypothetical protein